MSLIPESPHKKKDSRVKNVRVRGEIELME